MCDCDTNLPCKKLKGNCSSFPSYFDHWPNCKRNTCSNCFFLNELSYLMYKLLFSKQSEKIVKAYNNILLLMKCYEYSKNELFDYTLKQSKSCHHNIPYVKSWTYHLYKNNNGIIYTNKAWTKIL